MFALTTTESISIIPVLQKRAFVDIGIVGKYSSVNTSLFQTERTESSGVLDERISGVKMSYTRKLSAQETLTVGLLGQVARAQEQSDLVDIQSVYSVSFSKLEELAVVLSWTEQDSSLDTSEYKRVLASLSYKITFCS